MSPDTNSLFTSMLPMLLILLIAGAVFLLIYGLYLILRSPFGYPYFTRTFDVSGKRNVDLTDYIDRFLCDPRNWSAIVAHSMEIESWKQLCAKYLRGCYLKKRRTRQYYEAVDDDGAFQFVAKRDQTRYSQRNYVKTAYKVSMTDSWTAVSFRWLENRHAQLAEIGFEATLKEYHSKNQRKLMTQALREEIMKRDNYTCQICGKYMPDRVGLHIDHIVPVARGGKTVPSNLRVLCSRCNGRKGAK